MASSYKQIIRRLDDRADECMSLDEEAIVRAYDTQVCIAFDGCELKVPFGADVYAIIRNTIKQLEAVSDDREVE